MTLVREFARVAREARSIEELFRSALAVAGRTGGWTTGRVHLVSERFEVLRATDLRWHRDDGPLPEGPDQDGDAPESGEASVADRARSSGRAVWVEGAGEAASASAVLAVPVPTDGTVRGVLELRADEARPCEAALVREAEDLGIHLGVEIERLRLDDDLQRSGERLERVLEATKRIDAAGTDPEAVIQATAERIQDLTGATSASILVPSGDFLVVKGTSGNARDYASRRIPLDNSLSGLAFRSGEVLMSRDTTVDPRINWDLVRDTSLRSMVLAPLVGDDDVPVALLNVMSNEPDHFRQEHVNILRLLSGHMGSVLSRARAFRDNRRLVQRLTRTTRSLEDALERVQAILDASPHPIVAVDHESNTTLWSRAAERLYGWAEEEVRGRFPPMIPEVHRDDARRRMERVGKGETIHHVDLHHVRRDGGEVDVRVSLAPIRSAASEPAGVLAVVTDVSELRTVETRLRHAERMESIGRLAAGVAHDFNNLLTTIQGHADLLLTAGDLADDDRESVEEILDAVDRSAAITHQLLAYSRRQHLEPRPLDLSEVVRELSGLLGRLLGERVAMDVDLVPVGGPVMADRSQIDQVVMNLVVNARDAVADGGAVRISTEVLELDRAGAEALGDLHPGRYVRMSVADDGVGIPRETRKRIFEPFFSTKGPTRGTGMGLATVDGIIHQSGGAIHLETEVGKGSTFHVYLPLADDVDEGELSAPARSDPIVLLVEEAESVERLVRRILTARGYAVWALPSADAALDYLRDEGRQPALLLADQGRQRCRAFLDRVRKIRPELPIVLLCDDPSDDAASDRPGTIHVHKPFSPDMLEDAVARLVRS